MRLIARIINAVMVVGLTAGYIAYFLFSSPSAFRLSKPEITSDLLQLAGLAVIVFWFVSLLLDFVARAPLPPEIDSTSNSGLQLPLWISYCFALGLLSGVVGLVIFVQGLQNASFWMKACGSLLLAAGTVVDALALLRGEEVRERSAPTATATAGPEAQVGHH
jgi:hypothetical protein